MASTIVTGLVSGVNSTASPARPVAENHQAETPDVVSAAYRRTMQRVQKCRDLMLGTEAIRAGTTDYLPMHPSEGEDRYEVRLNIAALFNGFARTVQAVVGIILNEDPVLDDDNPQELKDMAENVDGKGTHLAVFAKRLATSGVCDGIAGILTEYPRRSDPKLLKGKKISLAGQQAITSGAGTLDRTDEAALGLRPYFILVKAESILLTVYESVNGKQTLVLLVIRENATERKGRFGFQSIHRYLIYQLAENGDVMYERWVAAAAGGTPELKEGPTKMDNLDSIPWSPLILGEEIGPSEYKPPMQDLADLNIQHHVINTGILSLESLACVPTPVRIGAPATKQTDGTFLYPPLVLGPSNTIEAPATVGVTTPVYWLSPPIDVLKPAMESLEKTEVHMGAMGATFLVPQKKVQETATASRMDATAEQSNVSSMSRGLKDCLESAFGYGGQYIKKPAGSITLNDDFTGEGINPQLLSVIVQAYQAGALTLEELRYVLQTGQLPEDFDAKDVVELLANEKAKQDQQRLIAQAALAGKKPPTDVSSSDQPPSPQPGA